MIVVKAFFKASCYLVAAAVRTPVKFFKLLLTAKLKIRLERISTILEADLAACAIRCHLTKPTFKSLFTNLKTYVVFA